MFELLLATHNAKKLAELRRIVEAAALGVRVVGLVDVTGYSEPEEPEPTFEGNALIKARAAASATPCRTRWSMMRSKSSATSGANSIRVAMPAASARKLPG